MPINAPMVFYYEDDFVVKLVSNARVGLLTKFIKLPMSKFKVNNIYQDNWTHPKHIPSQELGKIWLEKIFIITRTLELNPFNSSWFAWYDAGMAFYRKSKIPSSPWPNPTMLQFLPKDKILYTDSRSYKDGHSFSGTAFLLHKSIANRVANLFMNEIESCANDSKHGSLGDMFYSCGSDQIIWSRLKMTLASSMFHKVGSGYGTLIPLLGFQPCELRKYESVD
jgi:hypothetical protein